MVDAKKLVSDYLRAHPDIEPVRVVGKPPDNYDEPWIQVVVISGTSSMHPVHLVPYSLQMDCYAGPTGGGPEARAIARAVVGALEGIAGEVHSEGVPTGAALTSFTELPDTDIEPARDRTIVTATVWAHP